MGRKIFVSYKYSDINVQDLNLYQNTYFGLQKIHTTARHYVDKLSEIIETDDHIYKGEDDGQSLSGFSDEFISSVLRDKIYDSSITIVFVSKGMKDVRKNERDQWMPWEISYSLKEYSRNGRTSLSNAVIAIVLPDQYGSYDYYITHDTICNCKSLNTPFLFDILKFNMFNEKYPNTAACSNGSVVYHGDSCYIQSVKWEDFITYPNTYLDKAVEISSKKDNYNLTKHL